MVEDIDETDAPSALSGHIARIIRQRCQDDIWCVMIVEYIIIRAITAMASTTKQGNLLLIMLKRQ